MCNTKLSCLTLNNHIQNLLLTFIINNMNLIIDSIMNIIKINKSKKILYTLSLMSILITACGTIKPSGENPDAASTSHNSQNSVDWAGIYRGILPAASSEGIKTQISLNPDQTYILVFQYIGKSKEQFIEMGSFTWDDNGSIITLKPDSGGDGNRYLVGENQLFQLDKLGNRVTTELADHYILKKVFPDNEIREKYWKLIELKGAPVSKSEFAGVDAHFMLNTEVNTISGNGGCNGFNGQFELLEGSRIRFSKMATTMMACPNLEAEGSFFNVLETCDNYTIHNDTLSLNKARMAPLAKFAAVYFY